MPVQALAGSSSLDSSGLLLGSGASRRSSAACTPEGGFGSRFLAQQPDGAIGRAGISVLLISDPRQVEAPDIMTPG